MAVDIIQLGNVFEQADKVGVYTGWYLVPAYLIIKKKT